ncbi:MAG: type I-B CRISPR-associated protein Cas5 [Clostridiales bacterium]|jgi:CRISPR-associated protein Cas5t|nr:type I-B CRISPR-associated protein Cas5 [Clostridiales bacterium]
MKVYRIELSSWTASFRYPNLISGFQPTLDVPPISTVLGLINAAAGHYVEYSGFNIGYYFEYGAKAIDLETIYQIELKTTKAGIYPSNSTKPNVINREFLYDCRLYIYVQDKKIKEYFQKPYYPLVLGRSGDLVTIDAIEDIELTENNSPKNIKGQVVPFANHFLPGEIQALPKYFTNTIPRKNIGTEPFSVISHLSKNISSANIKAYTDVIDEEGIDIYFHQLNFSN